MRNAWGIGRLAVMFLLSSCLEAGGPGHEANKIRQGLLDWAPASNPFSQAIGSRVFPNGEDNQWRVVFASEFDPVAQQTSGKKTEPLHKSLHFFAGAEIANDGWSGGLYVPPANLQMGTQQLSGTNWIVLSDGLLDPNTDTLFATNYRLVSVPLVVPVSVVGYNPAIFMQVGATGMNRCCGPIRLCDTQGGPANPLCPDSVCTDGTTMVSDFNLGAGPARLASGFPLIQAQTYVSDTLFGAACFGQIDPTCTNSSPICDTGIQGNPFPSTQWNATIPVNNGSCAPVERPVSGRLVPKHCLYAQESTQAAVFPFAAVRGGSGPRSNYSDCDGQCFECETYKRGADSNIRPRQCDLLRPLPGDAPGLPGAPGSGVCTSTANTVAIEQAQLRVAAGVLPGKKGRGGCQTVQDQSSARYYKVCVECSLTECRKIIENAQSLIADGSPNKNTPTTCNTTETNCPALASGTGGGSAGGTSGAGAGTVTPPATSTTTPPPQPLKVNTDRTAPTPANGTTPAAANVVDPKTETTHDPIALSSGSFELRQVDLSFPGAVRPLEFIRTYDSRSRDRSVLGSNWSHNWDVRVVPLNDENRPSWTDPYCAGAPHETTCVLLYVGDAPHLFYKEFLSGVFVPQAGLTSTLIPLRAAAGQPDFLTGWLLESPDGHNLSFDSDGYLTRDVDRFGNGFSVEQEYTPSGRLFTTLCPRGISEMAIDPNDASRFIIRPQQGPFYDADSLDCRALGSVVGVRAPLARKPTGAATLNFVIPPGSTQEYLDARSLLDTLQNISGRQPGSPMPWGPRMKRVARVREITATTGNVITGTGRELVFNYYPMGAAPVGGSNLNGLSKTGLLMSVTGPAGARIDFDYQSPESTTGHPTFLNEAFLFQAKRFDGAAPSGLSPTPIRENLFTYAWAKNTLSPSSIAAVRNAFTLYWGAQANCIFTPVDNCASKRPPAMNFTDMSADLDDLEASYRAEMVDNIIKVTTSSVVESETRYETDPFSWSFDRAVKQRWGSSYAPQMSSIAPDWDTTLPEASLDLFEATPTGSGGTDDVTTNALPSQIAAQYGLETLVATDYAQRSGMLLPPNSPDGTVIPNQLAPIAEGTTSPAKQTPPQCKLQSLPVLRSRLPGYRPSHDYYDLTPQAPDSDSNTQGINVATHQLKRSRLSCEVLARAQTSDARTTDLMWTWINDAQGNLVATRSLGRRQFLTLNANRICAWAREANRDGVVRYTGINFQGRPLVDAVQGADGNYRFAETLYNADGNVISQRRPRAWNVQWSNAVGDSRYRYQDPVQSGPNPAQPSPWYWSRRSNVARVVERPKGATVTEYQETSGGTTTVVSAGRYTDYTYEKVFNQIQRVSRGWINQSQVDQSVETTDIVYDYQEGPASNLQPIIDRQQALGFRWPNDSSLTISIPQFMAELGLPFGVGDVNGDGVTTRFGLPSLVRRTAANGQIEVSAYRWNRGGRLIWLQSSDGAAQASPGVAPVGGPVLEFEYLALGLFSGPTSAAQTGFLGAIHHQPRKSWPAAQGPARAPCPYLAGPYQWLLGSNCSSSGLAAQLTARLKIPQEIADAIANQHAAIRDATTTFEYHVTGDLKRVAGPDPRAVEIDRDVDGRVTMERLIDNGVEHSRTLYQYDALLHPKKVTRMSGATYLGATERKFDEEGRVVFECDEFVQGGCVSSAIGVLPTGGASVTNWYTRDGRLDHTQDAEGLWTEYVRNDPRSWITTVRSSNPGVFADGTRTVDLTYDDDGNVVSRAHQGTSLSEVRTYDGYGRVIGSKDTQNRWFKLNLSPRDVLVRSEVYDIATLATLWFQWMEYDGFGNQTREYTNGTTSGFLTQELLRRPGGQVWSTRAYGKRPTYIATNADGDVMFSEDENGVLMNLSVAPPSIRERSSATVNQTDFLTTSTRVTNDVLGLPIVATEVGDGASRTRLSRATTFLRNRLGDVIRQDDVDGKSTEFDVDFGGRVQAKREWVPTTPPTQRTTSFTYDKRGAVLSMVDVNSQLTAYQYNSFGQIKQRETPRPGGTMIAKWTYDSLGRVFRVTPGGTPSYQHVYNNQDQLIQLVVNDVDELRGYTYDQLGRLKTARNQNRGLVATGEMLATNEWTYDFLGRVTLERTKVGTRPNRDTKSSFTNSTAAWQPVIRTLTRPDNTVTKEEFDTLGRVSKLTRGTGSTAPTTDFTYVGGVTTGQLSTSSTNTLTTNVTYDALGQALNWTTSRNTGSATEVLAIQALRDSSGRLGSYWRRDTRPGQAVEHTWRGYIYDSMRRVAKVHEAPTTGAGAPPTYAGAATHTLSAAEVNSIAGSYGTANRPWTYSRETNVGSVLSITTETGTPRLTAGTRGAGYQMTTFARHGEPTRTVTSDVEMGRVVGDGLDTFSWSILSELQKVTAGAGSTSTTEQYQYDGLGRLVARRNATGAILQEYAYDGSQMVVAYNTTATSVAWNATWGPGLDKLVSVGVGTTRYLALTDGRGSVGAYFNESTTAVASTLDYTPEGRVKWRTFNSSGTQAGICDQLGSAAAHTTDCDVGPNALPFGFHSSFKSPDSGLLYFRNRWLSTRTGEWLSPDPLGPVDSPNLYAFTGFDSVNNWDPLGLESDGLAGLDSGSASMEIQKKSGFNEWVFEQIVAQYDYRGETTSDRLGYRPRSAWDEVSSPTGNLGVARSGRGRGPMLACGACALVLPALEPLLVGGALTADALGLGIGVAGMGALSGISAGSRSDWLEGDPMDRKNVRNGQNLLNALRDTRKPPDNAVIASGRPASKPDLGKPDSATKPPGAQATPPKPTEPKKAPDPKKPETEPRKEQGPFFKTNKEAKQAAEAMGFKKIADRSSGQAVFSDGKRFITRDVDGHSGGAWKMADSVKNLGNVNTRMGTYDATLGTRMGD